MPKKVKLQNIKVKSFVTLENEMTDEIRAGASTSGCDTWCPCETLRTDCTCSCTCGCTDGCTAYTDCYPTICP